MMGLGERIKELRGDMSVVEFCRQFGIHRNTLPRYESGERTPDAEFITALIEHYGVDPSWLLMGEGEKYVEPRHRETAVDMAKDVFLGDPAATRRRSAKMKEIGGSMRAAIEAAGQVWREIGGEALPEPRTAAEKQLAAALAGLRARYEAAEFGRLAAEQQADEFAARCQSGGAAASDVDLRKGVELLAKIYGSGNQVLIRAIIANLLAFGEAIDNKATADNAALLMEEMNRKMAGMEQKLSELGGKVQHLEQENQNLRGRMNSGDEKEIAAG